MPAIVFRRRRLRWNTMAMITSTAPSDPRTIPITAPCGMSECLACWLAEVVESVMLAVAKVLPGVAGEIPSVP